MKTASKLFCIAFCFMIPASALATSTIEPLRTKSALSASATKTVTVTATIVKIDYRTGLVGLKDKAGKAYETTVAAKSRIDLHIFKAGDTVEATIAYVSASDSSGARARISKTELIRLQKK